MQSTGQTSTHAVSFVPMQGSVMMKGIPLSLHKNRYLMKWAIEYELPDMKNRAHSPAILSVPSPESRPITCGYHLPPLRIFTGGDQSEGSSSAGANET